MQYNQYYSPLLTKQGVPIPGKSMIPNSDGAYVFPISPIGRLRRFLVLGSEGGSFYASEQKLSRENAQAIVDLIQKDGKKVVDITVEMSDRGLIHKNDTAIFVMALCIGMGSDEVKQYAFLNLNKVLRIGTHLFQFIETIEGFRGWGRSLKRAVQNWYLEKPMPQLIYQLIKYKQRNKWSHRDVLRLAHIKPSSPEQSLIFKYVTKPDDPEVIEKLRQLPKVGLLNPDQLLAAHDIHHLDAKTQDKEAIKLIQDHKLPREAIPTEFLNSIAVWDALLEEMPLNAMVRNLGKMTNVGLLKPMSARIGTVMGRLKNQEIIEKSRLHPMSILLALKTYQQGKGDKGKLKWDALPQIVDALDEAFYLSFKNVQPTGKRLMLALDVSGSMHGAKIANTCIDAREASAALALITAKVEPNYAIMGFSSGFIPLNISSRQRMDDVLRLTNNLPFDHTNCALPMQYAMQHKLEIDAFVIYTDSETNASQSNHPIVALQQYRKQSGILDAKLIVVGMCSNGFTIADPNDAGMLDVVGFSADTPAVIGQFISGMV